MPLALFRRFGTEPAKRAPKRRAPAPAEITHLDVPHQDPVHGERIFRVALRRNPAARRITLRVSSASGAITLTLPPRADLSVAQVFANAHGGWIAQRLARVPEKVPFAEGAMIPLRGVPHRIVHLERRRGTTWAGKDPHGDPIILVAGEAAHLARRVRDFLMAEAKRDLLAAVQRHTATLGIPARRITIRDTRSRWGSCSATGALNFSWRMILAPPFVLDYLAAHEVAHLKELNHSNRFWRLTKQLCPATDEAEAWLKRQGSGLHRFG